MFRGFFYFKSIYYKAILIRGNLMFRIIHATSSQPYWFISDPSATFEPGQAGQLMSLNNQLVCSVSDGLCPIGIIDDIKTKSFSQNKINEEHIISITPDNMLWTPDGYVTRIDVKEELAESNLIKKSFSTSVPCLLNEKNGVITLVAGTKLNFNLSGGESPDAIRLFVCYTYYVPNVPGDDSTSSGRITIWYGRMIMENTMIETNVMYPVNQPVYINERGLFTTRLVSPVHPSMAMVICPPSTQSGFAQFLWW